MRGQCYIFAVQPQPTTEGTTHRTPSAPSERFANSDHHHQLSRHHPPLQSRQLFTYMQRWQSTSLVGTFHRGVRQLHQIVALIVDVLLLAFSNDFLAYTLSKTPINTAVFYAIIPGQSIFTSTANKCDFEFSLDIINFKQSKTASKFQLQVRKKYG